MKFVLSQRCKGNRFVVGGTHALLWLIGLFTLHSACCEEALVAVASNFIEPARELAKAFSHDGQTVRLSSGSTGALYAQVIHGAPFDVFLAADERSPTLLSKKGFAVPDSRFTYAIGSLVVWSADAKRIHGDCARIIKLGDFRHVAVANPGLAPYGAAAKAALQKWNEWEVVMPRLLSAESVSQAFQFVATGNAELGFVARSQALELPRQRAGSYCMVNTEDYPPILQQAVLLRHGEVNDTARQFLNFLRSNQGIATIRNFGYQAGLK
jgi:molybdate transport system substrate-binding protein